MVAQYPIWVVCKIPLLARALGLKAARPSTRATIGYLVYNYLGPYHLPLFKGSPQMLSTGSNRFERWQGNSDIIAFAFLFDAIICRIKIHFLVIMTSSDSVSISVISQDG